MHLYKLGKRSLSLLAILIALSIVAPGRPAAAQTGPRLAIEPSEVPAELDQTFTVKVVVEDVSDLGGYEIHLGFDPAVVELVEVEQGGFLESSGRSLLELGAKTDAEAGTVVVGAVTLGEVPGAEGGGELVSFTLRAVGAGESDLDLLDERVMLLDTASGKILFSAVDGLVRVGSGTAAETTSETPSPEPSATGTLPATAAGGATATATPTATPSEQPTMSGATATKTVTGAGTSAPTATIAGSEVTATSVPPAPVTPRDEAPSETRTSEAAEIPQTDEAEEEEGASSTSTGTAAVGATDAPASSVAPTAEAPAERPGRAGWRGLLIAAAAVLAVLGAALIGGSILLLRGRRQVDGNAFVEDEREMDDGSMQTDDPDRAGGGAS